MGPLQHVKDWFAEGIDFVRMISSSLSDKPDAWEWSIARFEKHDREQPPPERVIVFTGSSSITLWKTLEQDMAPLSVINRGFGGSKIHQVAQYVDRIVVPYHPRAVVLFAGTNDIAEPKPKTAQEVYEGYLAFVKAVHARLPETPIYYISITPTPLRWKLWPIVREANRLIEAHTTTDPRLHFIDMTGVILGNDGMPNRELFRMDRLHPNPKGYARWTATIKPILQADLLDAHPTTHEPLLNSPV
jgi:lysophospholipase L1-like esterase